MGLIASTTPGGITSSAHEGIQPLEAGSTPNEPVNVDDNSTEVDDGTVSEVGAPAQRVDNSGEPLQKPPHIQSATETDAAPAETESEKPAAAAAPTPIAELIEFNGTKMTPAELAGFAQALAQRNSELLRSATKQAVAPQHGIIPPPPQMTQEEYDALDPVAKNIYRWAAEAHQKSVENAQDAARQSEDKQYWGGVDQVAAKAVSQHIDSDPVFQKNVGGTLRNLINLALENRIARIRTENPGLPVPDAAIEATYKAVSKELRDLCEAYHQNITAARIKTKAATTHQASGGRTPQAAGVGSSAQRPRMDINDPDSMHNGVLAAMRRNRRN